MSRDEFFMRKALELARRGRTSPNPMVGALVVRKGRIVGTGFHRRAGLRHAEVVALEKAGKNSRGATLYVNLEPCSHYGRTPPCTDAIVESGVARVVAAMIDPNPLNRGKGMRRLAKAGIEVKTGVLEKEARSLNEAFIKFMRKGMPFVTVKAAQSLDGKIATVTGDSRWVTGTRARALVHRLRAETDAVLVGINTVIRDDPLLTVRAGKRTGKRQPFRIIVDSGLKIPAGARLLKDGSGGRIIIAVTHADSGRKARELRRRGVEIIRLPGRDGGVDLGKLFRALAKRGIISVLIEGGGEIIASALKDKLVDRMKIFIAPGIVGGRNAVTSVEGEGVKKMEQAIRLTGMRLRRYGPDLLIEGSPVYRGAR